MDRLVTGFGQRLFGTTGVSGQALKRGLIAALSVFLMSTSALAQDSDIQTQWTTAIDDLQNATNLIGVGGGLMVDGQLAG